MEIDRIGETRSIRHDPYRTTGRGHAPLVPQLHLVLQRLVRLDVDVDLIIIRLVVLIPMNVPGAVAARQHVFINHRRDDGARAQCFWEFFRDLFDVSTDTLRFVIQAFLEALRLRI